jgi:hypothetical protein
MHTSLGGASQRQRQGSVRSRPGCFDAILQDTRVGDNFGSQQQGESISQLSPDLLAGVSMRPAAVRTSSASTGSSQQSGLSHPSLASSFDSMLVSRCHEETMATLSRMEVKLEGVRAEAEIEDVISSAVARVADQLKSEITESVCIALAKEMDGIRDLFQKTKPPVATRHSSFPEQQHQSQPPLSEKVGAATRPIPQPTQQRQRCDSYDSDDCISAEEYLRNRGDGRGVCTRKRAKLIAEKNIFESQPFVIR